MPRYAPQSLPTGGSRPPIQQVVSAADTEEPMSPDYGQPAITLGQHIRRERGMQGVQRYVVSMRDHLTESEYEDLCHAMGVPSDLQLPPQHRPSPQHTAPVVQETFAPQQQPQQNMGNNMQMMQALMQMMGGMNGMGGSMGGGGMNAGGGMNPGGGMNMGGMNPMMLAQMLQGMGGMGGGANGGGMNPLMLAQMFGAMQGK